MTKTLILTPNLKLNCGMFQLAQDLAKEFDGDIKTKNDLVTTSIFDGNYEKVITLLYPMHSYGKLAKDIHGNKVKWINYNQGIPPITKTYFPNFWRRQAMRYINWRNNATMQGADEVWNVTEREQKPRWTEKAKLRFLQFEDVDLTKPYSIYIGRTTDYKNYEFLKQTMKELKIPLIHPINVSDDLLGEYLSNSKMLVTASIWEGFGRPCLEACALNIPVVCYDAGAHKSNMQKYDNKGICVPLDINNMKKSEEDFKKGVLEVWNAKRKEV